MFGLKKKDHGILWRSEEAAVLTGGQNSAPWVATGVAISVDDVQAGDLFFAAHGDDLELVFAKGAAAAVIPPNMKTDGRYPCLQVTNTFEALRIFANAARFRTHASIIAVQGECERTRIVRALSDKMDIYEGGGHISRGLAALPDDASCGVFGFAPSVAPDIAVITDCRKAVHSRVFQSMPAHGVAVLDETADGYLECLAAIKASGVVHIVTVQDIMMNSRVIRSKPMRVLAETIAQTMMQRMARVDPEKFAAFRVKSMIDLGASRTVILDGAHARADVPADILSIPRSIERTNLVYTSRKFALEATLGRALRGVKVVKPMRLQKIVPEVLTPGDYMIFKKPAAEQTVEFATALRLKRV